MADSERLVAVERTMGAAMGKLDSIMARLERMDADAARNARMQSNAAAHASHGGDGGTNGGGVGGVASKTLAAQLSRLSSKGIVEDDGEGPDFGGAVAEEAGEEPGTKAVIEDSDAWMINPTKPCVA